MNYDRSVRIGFLTLLLAGIGTVHLLALRPGHDWGGDFGMYLMQARNVVQGRDLADTPYIYNPQYGVVGPAAYPPITALLLAPVYYVAGADLQAMKLAMVAATMTLLVAIYFCLRGELPEPYLWVLLLLVGLAHHLLVEVNALGSDLPFMAFLYLNLLLVRLAYAGRALDPPRWSLLLGAAVAMYLCYGTRTIGIVLLPALALHDLIRYRRITPWNVAACSLFLLLAVGQRLFFRSEGQYFDQFGVPLSVYLENWSQYGIRMVSFWHNGYFVPAAAALFLAMLVLAAVGYWESLRRGVTYWEIFPFFYLVAVLAFPGYQGERYLFPLLPMYLLYMFRGLDAPWLANRAALQRVAIASVVGGACLSTLARTTTIDFGPLRQSVTDPQATELFDFVRTETAPDDVLVFVKPRIMALLTDRRTAAYHLAEDDRALQDYLNQINAHYLVTVERDDVLGLHETPEYIRYLRDFVARHQQELEPVFTNRNFRVWRRRLVETTGPGDRHTAGCQDDRPILASRMVH